MRTASFKHAHAGCGLAGVEDACLRAGIDERLLVAVCHGGDAAHALADVEHEAFGGEEALLTAADGEHDVAGAHVVAIMHVHRDLQVGVETMEDLFGGTLACKDSFFLDHQFALAHGILGDAAERGVVAVADILGKSEVDEAVGKFFFCLLVVHLCFCYGWRGRSLP